MSRRLNDSSSAGSLSNSTQLTSHTHTLAAPPASMQSTSAIESGIRERVALEELDLAHSTLAAITPTSSTPSPHLRGLQRQTTEGGWRSGGSYGATSPAVPTKQLDSRNNNNNNSGSSGSTPHAAEQNHYAKPIKGDGRASRAVVTPRSEEASRQSPPSPQAYAPGLEDGAEFVVSGTQPDSAKQWVANIPFVGATCVRVAELAEGAVPPGGHLSNIFNMASNTLGIGIVSMASGFNTTGIGLAVILMAVCMVLVVFSFYLIGMTCERSPYRSWESACRGILFRGADYCVAGVMIFFQFGTMVGFVTAAHDLIGPFIGDKTPDTAAFRTKQRLLTILVWICAMMPMCLPRRVASLRYFSIVGVTLVIYFVFAVVAHSAMAGMPHLRDMKIFATGIDAVNGLTLFIFAFLGHGLCFRLFDEMREPSAMNLLKDGCGSVSLIGALYFIVGFFGYAEFGLDMTGSIFKYYQVRDDPMMCVAYIGILMKICVAYALSGQACRLPVYYLLQREVDSASYPLHLAITLPLCVCSLIMGMFVPDINIVFNLLGSICGGILAFLLPAFFVMYLGGWTLKRVGWLRLGMTYLNIVAGVVAIVFGTAVTIDGMVS